MKMLLAFFLSFASCNAFTQAKPILVLDLATGILDTIPTPAFDTSLQSGQTSFNIGIFDNSIAPLEQVPPTINLYPGSQFTRKSPVEEAFDPRDFPIRSSVKIFVVENDSLLSTCSGSMVSRRHVLTANHCFTDFNTNFVRNDSILASPIFNNGNFSTDFNSSYASKIYFFQDWTINGDDFALLELQEPIGESTGWIGMGFEEGDSTLTDGIFYKFSYPNTTILAVDSNQYNGDTLYRNHGVVDQPGPQFIGISGTNGIPGESGSSIIKVENGLNYTTFGVLSFSTNLKHSRLDKWQFHALEDLIREDLVLGEEIPSNQEYSILPYPNPNHGRVWLSGIPFGKTSKVALFDQFGRKLRSWEKVSEGLVLDISDLPSGIFFLRVQTGSSTSTSKLIRQGW